MCEFMWSCCNTTYGDSERHFIIRASEHLGVILMKFYQLLIVIDCYLNMLPMKKGNESLFWWKKNIVQKLFFILIVYVNTNSNLMDLC